MILTPKNHHMILQLTTKCYIQKTHELVGVKRKEEKESRRNTGIGRKLIFRNERKKQSHKSKLVYENTRELIGLFGVYRIFF